MRKLFITALMLTVATAATAAHANTYTYMCRVGHKSYPVKLTTPAEATTGSLSGGTITWRGTVFRDVKADRDDCKVNFIATRNGVTVELCTATKGYAALTIGKATFDCQM